MNRTDAIREAAETTGEPVAVVERITAAFLDAITDGLLSGEVVNIRRFGKFELRLRRKVTRLNPRTGQEMRIPDKVTVTFIPSVTVKRRLNA